MRIGTGLGITDLRGGGGAYSPLDDNPVFWIDVSDATTLIDGGSNDLISVLDKVTETVLLTDGDNATRRLETGVDTIFNKNAVTALLDDYLTADTALNITGDWTLYLALETVTSDTTIQYVFTNTTGQGVFVEFVNATPSDSWGFFDGTSALSAGENLLEGEQYAICVRKSGTEYKFYTNGVLGNTSTGIDVAWQTIVLMTRGNLVNIGYRGKFGEAVLFSEAHSDTQIANMTGYMTDKWIELDPINFTNLAYDQFPFALNATLTEATVPVSGVKVASTPGNVEVRAVKASDGTAVSTYQTITVAGDNTFSGTITVPKTGFDKLLFEGRIVGDARTVKSRPDKRFTVGIVGVSGGQSNNVLPWAQIGTNVTPPEILEPLGENSTLTASISGGVSGVFRTSTTQPLPTSAHLYINRLATSAGVPVHVIIFGRSGTPVDLLLDPDGEIWTTFVEDGFNLTSPSHIHFFEIHQGESDNGNAANFETRWHDDWVAGRAQLAALTGQSASSIILHVQAIGTADYPPGAQATWGTFRYLQQQIADFGGTNVFFSAHSYHLNRYDDFHFMPLANSRRFEYAARKLAHRLGVDTDPGRFYISGLSRATGRLTLTLTHGLGTDFTIETMDQGEDGGLNSNYDSPTITADINSFEFSTDGGTTWTAFAGASVTRHNATTIYCDDVAIVTTGTLHFRYFADINNDGVVIDNSGFFVPLELTDPAGVSVT